MCGIFGYIGKNAGRINGEAVLESLRHRGPDGQGLEVLDGCLLAHTRLSILDLSDAGRQPMSTPDGRVWITFNGEIYNYLELAAELRDYPFRSMTDTEVILASYERWGEACLDRLRGMFSFAIWDGRENKLFCAVDRFAIKPFYYAGDGGELYFASEVRALAAAGVPLRPDDKTVHDYLVHGLLSHNERTFFEGVKMLRPGHCLVCKDGRIRLRRYWDLELNESPAPSFEECVDLAEQAITESVRLHLRSDVGYGLSLSSGLDSNFLRCVMSEVGGLDEPLKCYSYCFPGTPYDECVGLKDRDAAGSSYFLTDVGPEMLAEGMAEVVRIMEGPVGGLGIFAFWLNMQRARENGTKVIISGQGTDELFHGYKYFYEMHLRQLHERGETDRVRHELDMLNHRHGTSVEYGSEAFLRMVRPEDTSTPRASDGSHMNVAGYVRPEFLHAFGPWEAPGRDRFDDLVKSQVYNDINYVKMPKLLVFQDKMAMDHSVEVRVPMLDHCLYETLFSIPADYHLRGGGTKRLLREVSRRYVDPMSRKTRQVKMYMPTPQREWLKYELDGMIRDMVDRSVLHDLGYIDKEVLSGLYEDYVGRTELGNSFFVWKFMNMEFLFRAFFSGKHV